MNTFRNKYRKKFNLDKETQLDFDILKICSRVEIDDLEELYFNLKQDYLEKLKRIQDGVLEVKKPQDLETYVENKICYFLLKLEEARAGNKKRFIKNGSIAKKYLTSSE